VGVPLVQAMFLRVTGSLSRCIESTNTRPYGPLDTPSLLGIRICRATTVALFPAAPCSERQEMMSQGSLRCRDLIQVAGEKCERVIMTV